MILVDAKIADLIRLTFTSGDVAAWKRDPCKVTQTMDYGRVRLNGEDFLLLEPNAAEGSFAGWNGDGQSHGLFKLPRIQR